jgi:hypothetical protein
VPREVTALSRGYGFARVFGGSSSGRCETQTPSCRWGARFESETHRQQSASSTARSHNPGPDASNHRAEAVNDARGIGSPALPYRSVGGGACPDSRLSLCDRSYSKPSACASLLLRASSSDEGPREANCSFSRSGVAGRCVSITSCCSREARCRSPAGRCLVYDQGGARSAEAVTLKSAGTPRMWGPGLASALSLGSGASR